VNAKPEKSEKFNSRAAAAVGVVAAGFSVGANHFF
jgi:hypothetical protein